MNAIQYFKNENGMSWGAVLPGQFEESIHFWGSSAFGDAQIDLNKHSRANTSYYNRPDSSYSPCSQEEYFTARCKALATLTDFSSELLPQPSAATVLAE